MSITDAYLMQHGDRLTAAAHFARDLMRGDTAAFKQGYTPENAMVAVQDAFDLPVSLRAMLPEQMRQLALDELENTNPTLRRMGRALLEFSGLDLDDADAIERFADAIGFSSIPEACREIAGSLDGDA